MARITKIIATAGAIGALALPGTGIAQSLGDALKSSTEKAAKEAAQPAIDEAEQATQKVDEAAATAKRVEEVTQGESLSDTAKRAGTEGAGVGTDSFLKGSGAKGAAKDAGNAAVQEALKPGAK